MFSCEHRAPFLVFARCFVVYNHLFLDVFILVYVYLLHVRYSGSAFTADRSDSVNHVYFCPTLESYIAV